MEFWQIKKIHEIREFSNDNQTTSDDISIYCANNGNSVVIVKRARHDIQSGPKK